EAARRGGRRGGVRLLPGLRPDLSGRCPAEARRRLGRRHSDPGGLLRPGDRAARCCRRARAPPPPVPRQPPERRRHRAPLPPPRRADAVAGWPAEIYADAAALKPHVAALSRLPQISIDHLGMTEAGLPVVLELVDAGCKVKATGFGRVHLDVERALEVIARRS